ncbi:MAG TPA: NAD-dependent succinate-semialdehyde dehydrogenase [Bacteroidales bacterium]|nr:NAD-dependent succinate-semialdehyde dehydrogenase [Bacteroidales bacterium]
MKSIDPATNKILTEYREHTPEEVAGITGKVHSAWTGWKETTFEYRSQLFRNLAGLLRADKDHYARLMTAEMGKIIRESLAETEKCAHACDFYADHAKELLKDEILPTDASRSLVTFEPLGVVLAVMPWNFPFWQVFRFATTALMAGNAAVLKHASNVPGCALAIEELFRKAGFPEHVFRTLMIPSGQVETVIRDPRIMAVTLTGSEEAGSRVASLAGKLIKKTVLELGGSDAFIILEDADMNKTIKTAVTARMINQGQSCIAAKRFIITSSRIEEFESKIKEAFSRLKVGDPLDPATDVGPLARPDLAEDLDRQVKESVSMGARLITGGKRMERPGCYYEPTILADVKKGMPVYRQETFGPVVAIIPVIDEAEAIEVANDSEFGLGGSVWTEDLQRGEAVARKIRTGAMFVNGLVKSDPRLPFGGIKKSGYGRELSFYGIREFVNIKTIWIG